jgi:tetratricopeptide (TPR) repeat protein
MTAALDNQTRNVVPRWRSLENTIASRELVFRADKPATLTRGLADLHADWDEYRSIPYAADFAGAAIVAGTPRVAIETVPVLRRAGGIHASIADALEHANSPTLFLPDSVPATGQRTFGNLRAPLHRNVRNPVAWLELGRRQFGCGHRAQAGRSVATALQLAPHSRFVLRSASSFYIESGEPDRAAALLRDAVIDFSDPWLLAAELAARCVAQQRSTLIRKARAAVENRRWDPHDTSELAAQIATLEANAGTTKKAKALFRQSLEDPTENAIAQGAFVTVRTQGSLPLELPSGSGQAQEATARRTEASGDFEQALIASDAWLADQPFSVQAAIYTSYVAAVTRSWDHSVSAATQGLQVHPTNATLLNNLAYALIERGNVAEAESPLRAAQRHGIDTIDRAVIDATRGLLAYRTGEPTLGYSLYASAANEARREQHRELEAAALAMHASEEPDPSKAIELLQRANQVRTTRTPLLQLLMSRATTTIESRAI